MAKKLLLILVSLAVLAFAVPALASASAITSKAGILAPNGSKLSLTSTTVVKLTTSALGGTVECPSWTMPGVLSTNALGVFEIVGTGQEGTVGTCFRGSEQDIFGDPTITNLKSTGAGTGTMSFTLKLLAPKACKFTGTNLPFTYVAGTDTVVFTNAAGIKGPECGTISLDGSFTVETVAGATVTPVIFD